MIYLKKIACKLGFHSWGEVKAEPLKITGPHILFFSWGEQDGKKTCELCGKVQRLHREGFVGSGCENPKWEKV